MAHHRIQKVQGIHHIVLVILIRRRHRLPHVNEGGKMKHRFHGIFRENFLQQRHVRQIPLDELSPANRVAMAAAQIVQHQRFDALPRQHFIHVAADVSGPAHDQNHFSRPSLCLILEH